MSKSLTAERSQAVALLKKKVRREEVEQEVTSLRQGYGLAGE